jgi:pentatricopeptide repeat protein
MIACNTSGQWQMALQLYQEMKAAGHALNTTSYNALISAHSKAGDLSQVLDTYCQMVQQVRPPSTAPGISLSLAAPRHQRPAL